MSKRTRKCALPFMLPLVLGLVLVTACGGSGPSPGGDVEFDRATIRPLTADGLATLLADVRGDVVLVNLWATWCAPCLKEIPELIELENDLSARGFRLIGISLDDLDARDDVRAFRDQWFPEFSTYHIDEGDWYALIDQIQTDWSSLLPTSFVLDRDGRLAMTMTGGKDYASFAAAIEPLL